jgi:hypothetical protein
VRPCGCRFVTTFWTVKLQLEATANKLSCKLKRFVSRHGIRWQDSLMRGCVVVLENWRTICTRLSEDAATQIGKDTSLATAPQDFVMRSIKVSFDVEGRSRLFTGKVLLYMGELREHTDQAEEFSGSSAQDYKVWFEAGMEAVTAPEHYFVVHFSHDDGYQYMTLGEIDSALTTGRTTAFKDSPAGALCHKKQWEELMGELRELRQLGE